MSATDTETTVNPAPSTVPNPAPAGAQNEQIVPDPARIAELERRVEEAKRLLEDSTARIERALGR